MSPATPWLFVGPASSFPNIDPFDSTISLSKTPTPSLHTQTPICQILQLPKASTGNNDQGILITSEEATTHVGLDHQVLIFQFRNKFYAVDHKCPHQSYPLSRGTLHDIEDFGIRLSVGLTCPKHGWAFDVVTGESDRGRYQLGTWEVEVRGEEVAGEEQRAVWVRRRVDE